MDFDLQSGLHELSRTPAVGPEVVPVDRVLTRVHRERMMRGAGVGALSTGAVVGIAVAAWAVGTDREPPTPPAQTTAVPTPTPTAEPSPTVEPTPVPTADLGLPPVEPVPTPPLVAVTGDGEVVLLDPATGERRLVVGGISTDDPGKVAVTVDRSGSVAYVSHSTGPDARYEILRISLTSGTTEVVAEGLGPALSPDGGTLAYAGPDASLPEGTESWGLNLRDLATGVTRHLSAGPYDPARWVGQPTWAVDGTAVYLEVGWSEGGSVARVDPASMTSLEEVQAFDTGPGQSWSEPDVLDDGRLVLFSRGQGFEAPPDSMRVVVVDAEGRLVQDVAGLDGMWVADIESHGPGTSVAVLAGSVEFASADAVGYDLHLWQGGTEVTRLAQDLLAIAW